MAAHHETILVVEDDPEILMLIKASLENAGYLVFTAADGEEGLRVYQDLQSRIALLLTDVSMPKMSGLALADRILQCDSRLPVLFMSGDVPNPNRGSGWIEKPFRLADLARLVGQALEASYKERTCKEQTWPA